MEIPEVRNKVETQRMEGSGVGHSGTRRAEAMAGRNDDAVSVPWRPGRERSLGHKACVIKEGRGAGKATYKETQATQHTPLSGPELGVVSEVSLGKFSGKQSSCGFGCNSPHDGTDPPPEGLM